jgi:transposase
MSTKEKPAKTNANKPSDLDALRERVQVLEQQNAELDAKIKWYEEQHRLSIKQRFGSSSEKSMSEQINLFNEIEDSADPDLEEPTIETITYERRKRTKGDIKDHIKDLEEEVIEYRLPEDACFCPRCQHTLHEMSVQEHREIEIIPAKAYVSLHKRYIYSCRNCEHHAEDEHATVPVIKADMPKRFLPGTIASPSAVAYIIDQKYTNGMPLYRQEKQLARLDINLSRQTMSNWLIAAAQRWLSLLYGRMHEHLVKRQIIMADETSVQVLRESQRSPQSTSYMWLYRSNDRDGPPIVLFEYQTTRAGKHAQTFLRDFSGPYLQVDAYAGYNKVQNATQVLCMAHARRGFTDAIKALPADKRHKDVAAKTGLAYCNRLYDVERQIKALSDQERFEKRLELSKPILDEFYLWLKRMRPQVPPKSKFGQAIKYCLNHWQGLNAYLLDGRLAIDNSISERSIKNFVMGRRSWLFSATPKGAQSSAIIYSIIESAKENQLKPMPYLIWLFNQMPNTDLNDVNVLDSFMPWSDQVPQACKMLTVKE